MSDIFPSTLDQLPIVDESIVQPDALPPIVPWKAVVKRQKIPILEALKPKQPIKKRYFTAGVKVNEKNAIDLRKEPSPFSFPKDLNLFAYNVMNKAWRNDERVKALKEKYYNRTSYKDKQKMDLLRRLYVEETPVKDMKVVTDINPNYFEVVQDRPIAERLDIREYIDTVRDSLRTNIVIGYRQDDIALIDETLNLEQSIIDAVKKNLQSYIDTFEKFLLEDHSSAKKLLKEADETSKMTFNKYLEHNQVAQQYASINCSIYNVEDKWRLCKNYQKFLYSVSPLSWRREHSPGQRRTSIYAMQESSADFAFGGYRHSILKKGVSLEDIVQEFAEESADVVPPKLYFSKPDELIDVFKFMEMQNLNSLLHSEELAKPLESMKDSMKMSIEIFNKEIKSMQEIIDNLEGGISWKEERLKYLEELAVNLIDEEFKKLMVDEDVLNLQVIIEDVYEDRVGPNDANINMAEMMKAIEELYRQELLFFDTMPSTELTRLAGCYYQEEVLMMRLAERAAKQFEDLERITKNVKKAYEPPKGGRTARELKKRTPPKNPPKKVYLPNRSLTEREKDYLEHFTQFCFLTDNPQEYGIDTSPESQEKSLSVMPVESSSSECAADPFISKIGFSVSQ